MPVEPCLGTARFYFARLLPRIHSSSASVRAGSESLFLLDTHEVLALSALRRDIQTGASQRRLALSLDRLRS